MIHISTNIFIPLPFEPIMSYLMRYIVFLVYVNVFVCARLTGHIFFVAQIVLIADCNNTICDIKPQAPTHD